MEIQIPLQKNPLSGHIYLNGSKSISNRLLIINKVGNLNLEFKNLSVSNDTKLLQNALDNVNADVIDIDNCGTAMRFLTAYLSTMPGTRILTGDARMQERPIKHLVDALRQLGADIEYVNKEGFPPLKISGKQLEGKKVQIDSSVSSQYISALLMIAPLLGQGFELELIGKVVSFPYLKMTLSLLSKFGFDYSWENNQICISQTTLSANNNNFEIEADWSSASYWYSAVALAERADVNIYGLSKESLQGDKLLARIYSFFGVKTTYIEDGIHLTKTKSVSEFFMYDFSDTPDLAQTVAVTCAALKIPAQLNGLETLNIKETNRIIALATELEKCGVTCIAKNDCLQLLSFNFDDTTKKINTYNDHRMAMAFFPLSLKHLIIIDHSQVVEKSYPAFFNDAKAIGFEW